MRRACERECVGVHDVLFAGHYGYSVPSHRTSYLFLCGSYFRGGVVIVGVVAFYSLYYPSLCQRVFPCSRLLYTPIIIIICGGRMVI